MKCSQFIYTNKLFLFCLFQKEIVYLQREICHEFQINS